MKIKKIGTLIQGIVVEIFQWTVTSASAATTKCRKINKMAEKVYVITGSSSGIGVGITECLAKAGIKKLVLVARRKERLEQVAESCKKLGATDVHVLSKDLYNLDSCPQIVEETINKFGSKICFIIFSNDTNSAFLIFV